MYCYNYIESIRVRSGNHSEAGLSIVRAILPSTAGHMYALHHVRTHAVRVN